MATREPQALPCTHNAVQHLHATAASSETMPPASPTLRSFRTHIAFLFGALGAALAIVICLLWGEFLKLRLQQHAAASLHVVAHNAAVLLQQDLKQQSRRTQVLAKSEELWEQGLGSRGVSQMLHRLQQINPHNVWIGVTDVNGIVLNDSGNLLRGVSVAQRPWFKEALKGPFISDVHPAKLLASLLPVSNFGEPLRLVDFSAPIHAPDGKLMGVLGIHGNWNWARDAVEQLLQGTARDNQQSIFIFDQQGEMIYAPNGAMSAFAAMGQGVPEGLDPLDRKPQVLKWQDRRTPFLTSAVRLPAPSDENDLGWLIVARQPVETAYADANRVLWFAIAYALLGGVLAAGVAWYVSNHVSNDLEELATAASNIQGQGPEAHIPLLHSNREIYKLSNALLGMTEKLMQSNAHMQEQVRLRTQELQDLNAELHRQANTDALTQLLNRRGFEAQARLAFARARRTTQPLSSIALDIDFFKRINDQFGHETGDLVLAQLGSVLLQRMRETDIVARIGGEEFIVLLPDTGLEATQRVAQSLIEAIAGMQFPAIGAITISAGISTLHPNPADGLHEMLKRSDDALYAAKRTGRNRVCRMA